MIEWGSIATGVGLLKNLRELFKKKEPDAYIADVRVCQASLEDSGELLPFYDLTLELYVERPHRFREVSIGGFQIAHRHFEVVAGSSGMGEFVPSVCVDESLWSSQLSLDWFVEPTFSDRRAKISFWCRRVNVCDKCLIELDNIEFLSSQLSSLLLNPATT